MTVRVIFVAPAIGSELREVRFGDDAPPDDAGLAAARAAAGSLPAAPRCFTAPARRCRFTADALGITAAPAEALADLDVGSWRGLSLEEVAATQPAEVSSWLADPTAAPHGGESVTDLCARVGGWLEALADQPGRVLAVAEPAVVRAAVVHALDLPAVAFWRLDVRPLSATELSGRSGRWNLRCGAGPAPW
ncbi:histidine phosphatase family protein [Kitasatospora sp. NPDC057940]|uniref:histidine phosphatase family protein n=1 Tax=Kitasatospora sp. NPDC057940 TaxID=3346285 RepID=UPI0036DB49AE